jgi:streptogramin lyase
MLRKRLCLIAGFLAAAVVCPAQVTITEFPLPLAGGSHALPNRIVAGPDGKLWFTESGRIGTMTTAGVSAGEFPIADEAVGITVGPDGKLWYASQRCCSGSKIGSITTAGVITEFSAPGVGGGIDVTRGPDGNLWFTELQNIARMTTAGVITAEFPSLMPSIYSSPDHIVAGPDGNLWFTEGTFGGFGRITPAGVLTKFTGNIADPSGLTVGPDGNLWFTDHFGIGRITPTGAITHFSPPDQNMGANELAIGPDGNLWFSGAIFTGTGVGRITLNALGVPVFDFFPAPTNTAGQDYHHGIVTGPDGSLWFTEYGAGKIGKVGLPGPRITNVSSTNADGVYGTGAQIAITITFGASVTVTGTPKLTLNSGGKAIYTSGSGTSTLTFTYTIASGESSLRLEAASFMALAMNQNWGSIRDSSAKDAILTLPVYPTAGSLGANKLLVINPPDNTPPVSAASASPGPNGNGWNKTDVTVAITATDIGGSGVKQIQYTLSGAQSSPAQIVSGSTASVTIATEGITTITYFATDNIGNVETAKTLTIRLDKNAPTVTFTAASPAPNAAGWNKSDVSIAFTVADTLSGVDSSTAVSPLTLTTEGSAVTGTVTVTDMAGNSATFTSPAVKIDKTRPAISGSRAPLPNPYGWNNTNVTVSFSCSDTLSGLAPGSPPTDTTLSSDGANQSASGTCQDVAGNTTSLDITGINLDKTPPAVTAAAAPAPNAAGWNNTNVVVTFTGTGSLSGLDTCATAASLTAEGAGQSASGTCTDKAGNVSAPATASGINIDKTPPVIGGSRAPAANAAGWNNTDVIATFTCSDAISGLVSGNPPSPVTFTVEGENQSVTRSCQDAAGNSATYTIGGISIDKTPPTANGSAAPAANAAGWNNTTVTVSFTGSDSLSGLAGCTAPVPLPSEGAGQSASGTCTDKAGNSSTTATVLGIKIDKTPPSVTFDSPTPAPNAAGWNNSNVSIPFTVTDSLSGVQSTNPGASPLTVTSEGTGLTGSVTVTDKAGNTATFTSPALKIDKTPPVLLGSSTPAANASGWNNTDVTVTFTCSDALAGVASLTPGASTVVSSEGANQLIPGTCQDLAGNTVATTLGPIKIDKTKPVVSDLAANPSAVPLNSGFTLNATLIDGGSGVALAEYSMDSGAFTAMNGGSGLWSASVPSLPLGVHNACVRSTDNAGNQGAAVCILVPIYDPSGGFVTGGGWITSPTGAYTPNPSLTGKANFGFVAKYEHGANVPSGDTQFQFQTANFNFKSTDYQWLVVAGARAQFKGSGTINGSGNYDFMLTAIDGEIAGGGGVDKFRIKIWDSTGIVYDNQMGSDDTGNAATALGGGSIVIHQ